MQHVENNILMQIKALIGEFEVIIDTSHSR